MFPATGPVVGAIAGPVVGTSGAPGVTSSPGPLGGGGLAVAPSLTGAPSVRRSPSEPRPAAAGELCNQFKSAKVERAAELLAALGQARANACYIGRDVPNRWRGTCVIVYEMRTTKQME